MLKRLLVGSCAAGVIMFAAGGAPAVAAPHQAKAKTEQAAKATGKVVSDAAITTEVKTKLLAAKGVPGSAIDVDTTNGVVTLKGTVPSAASRAKALRIARRSSGVKRVVNELKIGHK